MATLKIKAVNRTNVAAVLVWCDGESETTYAEIQPGVSKLQETFHGHVWRLKNASGTVELTVDSEADGQELLLYSEDYLPPPSAEADAAAFYTQCIEVGCAGLKVRASNAVAAGAVIVASDIAGNMLRHSPASVLSNLAAHECSLAVIGRDQVTSDIPEHREWARAASRPAEPSAEQAAQMTALPPGDDALAAQRQAMARALEVRLEAKDATQLRDLLCSLVERGLLSDAIVRDALDSSEPSPPPPVAYTHPATSDAALPTSKPSPSTLAPPAPEPADAAVDREPMQIEDAAVAAVVAPWAEAGVPLSESAKPEPSKLGRDGLPLSEIDATTRGVGGGAVTSVGEENLLDIASDPHFRDESILCHEFGHTVMNIGLSDELRGLVRAAHADAIRRGLYPVQCYMGSNADEYWAEATQAWFDATVRTDVNQAVNSRARLCAHDPAIALLMRHAYGDGAWRFTDCLKQESRDEWRGRQQATPPPAKRPTASAEPAAPPRSEAEDLEEQMLAQAIAHSLEGAGGAAAAAAGHAAGAP